MKESTAFYAAIDAMLDVAEYRDRETVIAVLGVLFKRLESARILEERDYTRKREV